MKSIIHCPYCNEEININAKKCKHCGEWLDESARPIESQSYTSSDPTTFVKMALANKYELLEKIGKGGMAVVYKARQKNLDRIVALKVIHQNLIHDEEFLQRFHREAKIASSLNHSNIITIYDEGIEKGVHFIAMEYIEGNDLYTLIKQRGRLSEEETINIIIPISEALDYAHKRGIIHRDVKSSNIIVSKEGRIVLTDFGIARTVSGPKSLPSGRIIGTPEYMSPEQADGKQIDHRSDIYSLGVVMYECLTGGVPFRDDNPITTMYKIINHPVPEIKRIRPEISEWLASIVDKCLLKSVDKRFQSCKELSYSLKNFEYSNKISLDKNLNKSHLDDSHKYEKSNFDLNFNFFRNIFDDSHKYEKSSLIKDKINNDNISKTYPIKNKNIIPDHNNDFIDKSFFSLLLYCLILVFGQFFFFLGFSLYFLFSFSSVVIIVNFFVSGFGYILIYPANYSLKEVYKFKKINLVLLNLLIAVLVIIIILKSDIGD